MPGRIAQHDPGLPRLLRDSFSPERHAAGRRDLEIFDREIEVELLVTVIRP